MGKRVAVMSALLALLATFLLAQPAGAREEDPCAARRRGAILGTAGSDVLRGTPGADVIVAGDGNDVVNAGPGADFLPLAQGNDTGIGGGTDQALTCERQIAI